MSERRVTDGHADEIGSLGAESVWIDNGPVRLHALDYGGSGPPLLVLPGIASPAITWDFVVAPLRDAVRPVVLDLRGRGLSSAADSYTLGAYAGDAEALVSALGLARPLLLGHSLGARIAAAVAVRRNVEVGGVIAVDPPLSGPDRGPYPIGRESFARQLGEAYAGTTADEVARHYPGWARSELALRARWLRTCDSRAVMQTLEGFAVEDFFDLWPRMPRPTAVVRGERSPVATSYGAAELTACRPEAPVLAVPRAGHMVPWDNYDDFMAALRSLLGVEFGVAALDSDAA